MTEKECANRLTRELEESIKQEILMEGRIKDYLYDRKTVEAPLKDLVLGMHEIQNKKRTTHKKLRGARNIAN